MTPSGGRHGVSDTDRRLLSPGHRRRARRRALVHRERHESDRPHHDRRRLHRVSDPDRREQSLRHRRRPRRRALVHRKRRRTRSDASPPPASSPSSPSPPPGPAPHFITAGPDGNLWFTEQGKNKIGRLTPAGVFTEFPDPDRDAFPEGIAAGADGNLWFVENSGHKVGRITTDGTITEFPLPVATRAFRICRRARRQPLVHRVRQQQDRPHHDRRRHHRVPDPDRRLGPLRHHRRARQRPLVHGIPRGPARRDRSR